MCRLPPSPYLTDTSVPYTALCRAPVPWPGNVFGQVVTIFHLTVLNRLPGAGAVASCCGLHAAAVKPAPVNRAPLLKLPRNSLLFTSISDRQSTRLNSSH